MDYQVPLFPQALKILEKYKNNPRCLQKDRCLPVPSNVKYNAYLEVVGDMAEIQKDKPFVSHLARKTFACTISLANGMNIGVLSKIRGHASIQVTFDSYATVIDELMIRNVKDLKNKLTSGNESLISAKNKGKRDAKDALIDKAKKASRN
jgi:integrase